MQTSIIYTDRIHQPKSDDNASFHSTIATNLTVEDWGPIRDPLYIVIPISIFYIATFFSGVLGNVSTCIVIARNKSMHTATNYYLFSLAISDLLLLTSGLPTEIYFIWYKYSYYFGDTFCILQGFAAETSANATVLTITAFTIERYVAICHPFLSHTLSKLNRAIKFIIAIWIKAICLAIPQAVAIGIVCEKLADGSIQTDHCICMVKRSIIPHAFLLSTVVFFIAPMSLITVLYILIGIQLHRSTVGPSRGNSVKMRHRLYRPAVGVHSNCTYNAGQAVVALNNESEQLQPQDEEGRKNFAKNAQATKHVVKMLIAVVVAFFICWAPFHAQRLLATYSKSPSKNVIKAFKILTYVSGILYYLSTTINPLLYHIMSNKFREAFKNTYKQCYHRGQRIPGGRCYSTLSAFSASQVNSHSTDSYSRHCSVDAEMVRLPDPTRPLVVSFRRKRAPPASPSTQRRSAASNRLIMDVLNSEAKNYDHFSFGGGEAHLQPMHICPLNAAERSLQRKKPPGSSN